MDFPDTLLHASLIGDRIALGPHWIYDHAEMDRQFPDGLKGPESPRSSYHAGKKAGDQTHYGDQTKWLADVLRGKSSWSDESWRDAWLGAWKSSTAYQDKATRQTIARYESGDPGPSESDDLGGAARLAAVFQLDPGGSRPEIVIAAARAQAALTHGALVVAGAAEFLTKLVYLLREGHGLESALQKANAPVPGYHPGADLLAVRGVSMAVSPRLAGARFGLHCGIAAALPFTLWLAWRFESAPAEALVANALAGGDSAARGLVLGLLLAARNGLTGFPEEWLNPSPDR